MNRKQLAERIESLRIDEHRWSRSRADAWYTSQPWMVGANYITSDAINQLEMFQAETFNASLIDRELGLAESIGMNVMRVFLHDRLWEQDAPGLIARFEILLEIAARHGIKIMPVLFDSCWNPHPCLGAQPGPTPGVHNSGWVQSPGAERLTDAGFEPALRAYVEGFVGAFATDERILLWDIWNEPDNDNFASYAAVEVKDKARLVLALLTKAFGWARSMHPVQPLTSGVWTGEWADPARQSEMVKAQLALSDVLSFHDYDWAGGFEDRIRQLLPHGRPILCTEYMGRGMGSTFSKNLPIAKEYRVAAMNWGFVAGKTQTYMPWDSWQTPYIHAEPEVWFHEVFRHDWTPYSQDEVALIRELAWQAEVRELAVA